MCDCIKKTDELLKEHNSHLITTILATPQRVVLATEKINTRDRKKGTMVASFCPFCGEKYAA